MELYLQCGYGMMQLCRELISRWNGGTVILSPRDNDGPQLNSLAKAINALPGGAVLLDPQFYLPHADHANLCAHEYWPKEYDTGTFLIGPGLQQLMKLLLECNNTYGCREFVIPGFLGAKVDDDWLNTQQAFLDAARRLDGAVPMRMTISLTSDAIKDESQIAALLEHAAKWNAPAYYVVCEHPPMQYMVEDPTWVSNVIDVCAGLKLLGSHVLLGYSNQQMLLAAVAKVDAIASGTWMNVRSFRPDKFQEDEGDIKRKATWYYCPHALTEYKVPSLDIAKKLGVLPEMAPQPDVNGGDVDVAFRGTVPPSTVLTEPLAFRHFLHSIRAQAGSASKTSFDDTCDHHDKLLDIAAKYLKSFSAKGIRGDMRDFGPAVDANKQALEVLKHTRGAILRRKWAS